MTPNTDIRSPYRAAGLSAGRQSKKPRLIKARLPTQKDLALLRSKDKPGDAWRRSATARG